VAIGRLRALALAITACLIGTVAFAQPGGSIAGRVTDETGGALPGVTVELRSGPATPPTVTNSAGEYSFNHLPPGRYEVSFALINFASARRRDVTVQTGITRVDAVMHLSVSADVTASPNIHFHPAVPRTIRVALVVGF
jgi:hypothetical protein